ncbi:MAG: enoyl-CoA hydratase/isomerase family protein [Pseudomonadota bacterium]|nr:enoyl-CoA hydratase/isomerase family protein [Pseudomonadota bacterium]
MTPSFECVEVGLDGAVGHLRLNRPSALNACNVPLMDEVIAASKWFNEQEQAKVVIVSGSGKAFCAGFDLRTLAGSTAGQIRSAFDRGLKMAQSLSLMRPVTVAAIHGHCIGGGVVVAAACDFRYAAADATFQLPETELGIPLAWGSIPWLVRELGPAKAMEFVLLCKRVEAARMHAAGFLNDVTEAARLDAHVAGVASALAARSRLVLEGTKRQVIAATNEMAHNASAFLESHLVHSAMLDEESMAHRHAYLEKVLKTARQ